MDDGDAGHLCYAPRGPERRVHRVRRWPASLACALRPPRPGYRRALTLIAYLTPACARPLPSGCVYGRATDTGEHRSSAQGVREVAEEIRREVDRLYEIARESVSTV